MIKRRKTEGKEEKKTELQGFGEGYRFNKGQTIGDLDPRLLDIALKGIADARHISLGNAEQCLTIPEKKYRRNIWNASLSCGGRGVERDFRTGISLPIDARLQSLSYGVAEEELSSIMRDQKDVKELDQEAYLVDAIVDGTRIAVRSLIDDDVGYNHILNYLRTGTSTQHLDDVFSAAVIEAIYEELGKRRS